MRDTGERTHRTRANDHRVITRRARSKRGVEVILLKKGKRIVGVGRISQLELPDVPGVVGHHHGDRLQMRLELFQPIHQNLSINRTTSSSDCHNDLSCHYIAINNAKANKKGPNSIFDPTSTYEKHARWEGITKVRLTLTFHACPVL